VPSKPERRQRGDEQDDVLAQRIAQWPPRTRASCGLDYRRLVPHVRGAPFAVMCPLARERSLRT
jgi:hypothetical protein